MALEALISLSRCREGAGTFVEHDGCEYAVFRLSGDEVVVLDNSCPHASGNLSGGPVSGGIVSCPWHHWRFDIRTGVCTDSAQARARVYPSRVVDGVVYLER